MTAKPSLNPALRDFWATKSDIKILKGGRSSSKTWDASGFAIYLASKYCLKFLCMRQFQNKIKESVYAVLVVQIDRFGLRNEFEILHNIIKHRVTGSEFHFYGIHRHINEIKGFEGADIGWLEEGEGLTAQQWKIIEPTFRKEGSEVWIIYNPNLILDFVETFKHNLDKGISVRHINYDENPFISETMLRKINALKSRDYDEYVHVYLGIALANDEQSVIRRSWIEASIDAHLKLNIEITGSKCIGFDLADSGKDKNAITYSYGILAVWSENWKGGEDELLISCTRAYAKAIEFGSSITYDSIGVGAGAGPKFQELNDERQLEGLPKFAKYTKFVAGAKVVNPEEFYIDSGDEQIRNKDFFCNLKSQAWWLIADRFRNTYNAVTRGEKFDHDQLISIDSQIPNLGDIITQLSTPRRRFDNTGKVKVESKEDLMKRGVDSPNDADSFVMAFAPKASENFGDLLDLAIGN